MNLLVRSSRDTDLPAITRIYAQAVLHDTASFELEPPDEAEMARRRSALLKADYPYVVAERDGAVIGYAYAGPYRTRPAYRSTVENSIYIDPAARGQGIGRILLETLIRECEARDFRLMVAIVADANSAASLKLHRRLGFALVGTLDGIGHKHGRWLATVLMQRALGPGTSTPPTRPA